MRQTKNSLMMLVAVLLVAAYFLSGCASMYVANTKVRYTFVKPDGTRIEAEYDSGKDQSDFNASLAPDGTATVNTARANTPEAATKAAAESLGKLADMFGAMLGMAMKFLSPVQAPPVNPPAPTQPAPTVPPKAPVNLSAQYI